MNKRSSKICIGLISLAVILTIPLVFFPPAALAIEYTFTPIDVPGSNFTQAFEINDLGQIVGDYRIPPNSVDHGYLLNGGIYLLLDVSSADGINNSGQIVGQIGSHGFLLSGGSYTTFDVPGSPFTQPLGINDAGHIVGVFNAAPSTHSFLLSGGAYTTLDVPGASYSQANGINNSDEIVGYYVANGQFHGFLLSGGSYTTLDFPGSPFTIADGINNVGQIVGEYAGGITHGFLATPVAVVPEPSTLLLFGFGFVGLVGFRRKLRK